VSTISSLGPSGSPGQQGDGCVGMYSMVLVEDICCFVTTILAIYEPCMAHNFIFSPNYFPLPFFHESLARHPAPNRPPIVELLTLPCS